MGVPQGYVAYGGPGAVGQVQQSSGLRKATVALFWLTAAASGLLALAFFSRKSAVDDFFAGTKSLSDVVDSDNVVRLAASLQGLLTIAAVIVLCLWSRRIAKNAQARGAPGISPGLACGGWWIPIGFYWVGFGQLKKSVVGVNKTSPNLIRWQIAFVVQSVLGFIVRSAANSLDMANSGSLTSTLNRQGALGLVSFALFAVTAFFAMKAMSEVDTAVSTIT